MIRILEIAAAVLLFAAAAGAVGMVLTAVVGSILDALDDHDVSGLIEED